MPQYNGANLFQVKKDKLNILITSPNLNVTKNVSGISSVVQLIMENTDHFYIQFSLGSEDKDKQKKNLTWLIRQIKIFVSYYKKIKNTEIDLVHLNVPCDTKGIFREYVTSSLTKFSKKKVLIHLHGGEFLMKKPSNFITLYCLKKVLQRGEQVIVLSQLEKESLSKLYNFSHAIPLPNSVDISPIPYHNFNVSQEEKKQILFLGRIHESKGIFDIIPAFEKLYKEIPFKFVVCGTGPQKDDLIVGCQKFMKDDFVYRGIVSGQEKMDVISVSDIFVLPSRYGEGLPMALLETMAAGLVPVVTNDASMEYVIKDNYNGIVVNKQDPEDIYLKISSLLKNQGNMRQIGNNARKTIENDYNADTYVKKLNEIYYKICQ